MRVRGSALGAYFVALASMPHKHGTSESNEDGFRAVAQTVAVRVLRSEECYAVNILRPGGLFTTLLEKSLGAYRRRRKRGFAATVVCANGESRWNPAPRDDWSSGVREGCI